MTVALRVVDLFSGAGGLSLGFHAAGFSITAAIDADPICASTFDENFSRLQPGQRPLILGGPEKGDASRIHLESLGRQLQPDVLIGGPPCQGFSRVGRAKLNSLSEEGFEGDPRNELFRLFLHAAAAWRPLAVVMENVPGIVSVKGENVGELAAADLASLGYETGYAILNAAWYGVPQFRERFFMIGLREDLDVWPALPAPTHRAEMPSGYVRPLEESTMPMSFVKHYQLPVRFDKACSAPVTVEEAIGDLPQLVDHIRWDRRPIRGDFRRPRSYNAAPHSDYARLMRAWPGLGEPRAICDHEIRRTPRDYETFRRMRPGDRYPQAYAIMQRRLAEELARLDRSPEGTPATGTSRYGRLEQSVVAPYPIDGFPDKWRKLIRNAPSWTVPAHLAKDSYSHIHYDDDQARMISVREAARLQSFPDAFQFLGNMGDCFRQIGNAVPPLLAKAIAEVLARQLGHDTGRLSKRSPSERSL